MMTSFCMVIFCVLIAQLSVAHGVVNVDYKYKNTSNHIDDGFGQSLSTWHQKLVIGASSDKRRGSVVVEEGVRISPHMGKYFGHEVDVNQQFIVASGLEPSSVYVYESSSPYHLKARIPVEGWVVDVKISDLNTIALIDGRNNMVNIYVHDGHSSWHIAQKLDIDNGGMSLALSKTTLAVGVQDQDQGLVHLYNNIGGKWTKQQTIRQGDVQFLGESLAMFGRHLAASSKAGDGRNSVVLTYELDITTNTWINNGRFTLQTSLTCSLSMHEDILAATVTDFIDHPNVSGYAYKVSKTTNANNNNNNNNNNESVSSYEWSQIASLTTTDDPVPSGQYHMAISVQDRFVFTGRCCGYWYAGKVFAHDLSGV